MEENKMYEMDKTHKEYKAGTEKVLASFNVRTRTRIKNAMEFVRLNYEAPFIKHSGAMGNYKRVWRTDKQSKGVYAFAYNGSPDKGFVFLKHNRIFACNQQGEKIGEF